MQISSCISVLSRWQFGHRPQFYSTQQNFHYLPFVNRGNKTVPEKVATTRTEALKYRQEGRRNIGRPKKRWRDQLHFED